MKFILEVGRRESTAAGGMRRGQVLAPRPGLEPGTYGWTG